MTPEDFDVIRTREKSLYDAEVAVAVEPKLHILLVHLYIEHPLERLLTANLKSTKRLFGKNRLSFEKKLLIVEAIGTLKPQRIDGI